MVIKIARYVPLSSGMAAGSATGRDGPGYQPEPHPVFNPSDLLQGRAGIWTDIHEGVAMRLFQDAAGTVPAYLAGQPVGLAVRKDGTFNLSQSTALSRPTLARWPKGGVRNLAMRFGFVKAPTSIATTPGFTDPFGGNAAVKVEFTDGSQTLQFNPMNSALSQPTTFSSRLWVKGVAGETLRRRFAGNASETNVVLSGEWQLLEAINVTGVSQNFNINTWTGATARTVYYYAPQSEIGSSLGPYQQVNSANDVTEAGVPEVWHLWNDGGDSLMAPVLETAQHAATVSVLGRVEYADKAAGAPAKDYLSGGERIADIFARDAPLTDAERLQLEEFWQAQTGASYLQPPGMVPGGGRGMWQGLSLEEAAVATPVGVMTLEAAAYGPELRGTFSDIKVGTPPEVPAYNASTGQGYVARSTSADVQGVRITSLDLSGPYVIDLENTGEQALNLRTGSVTGSSLFSVQPGVRTRRVVPGGYASMAVAPAFDNVTTSFTLHSFRKLDSRVAQQDTALSRPTLARWPRGGRRNILLNSEAFDTASWVVSNATISGGILSGVSGLAGSIRQQFLSAGGPYIASVRLRAGSAPTSVLGFRNETDPAWLVTAGGILSGPGSYTVEGGTLRLRDLSAETYTWAWFRVDAAPAGASISLRVYPESLSAGTGKSVEISRAQVESGTEVSAYQKVTYSSDVTETGVPEVWHLFNDGGDSLPAVVPAGAYEIAWVDVLGAIRYASDTSDGATGIDLLRAERMADVAIKRGAFTAFERSQLSEVWGKYKA